MLRNKKILLVALATLTTIIFLAYQISAQGIDGIRNKRNYNNSSGWNNSNIPEKYWLSNDQMNQVNKIKTEYDDRIQPEIEKLNSVRGEFSDYQNKDDINNQRVREYQSQIRGIEDNIYSFKMEAGSKIRKVLTNNQRAYYNDSRIGWWDGFYERCGWDYADMSYGMRNHGYMDCGMRGNSIMYNRDRGCW